MAITAFNLGGSSSKIYLGNEIWRRNSTFAADQSVYLSVPKGAIGLICTSNASRYSCSFSTASSGTVLVSESSGNCERQSTMVLLFTEALKNESHLTFYYGSGSGCNFVMYPVMMK